MVAEGQENTALKQASLLAMDDIERAMLKDVTEAPSVKENAPGSYERFMRFAGGMSA